MAIAAWANSMAQEIRELRAEIVKLREFVEEALCECYDGYGNRRPRICDRCRLLGREEDETRPT